MKRFAEEYAKCVHREEYRWTTIELREHNSTVPFGSFGDEFIGDGTGFMRIIPQKDDQYEYWIALSNINEFIETLKTPRDATGNPFRAELQSLESGCELCHKRLKGHMGVYVAGADISKNRDTDSLQVHTNCTEKLTTEIEAFVETHSETVLSYSI